MSNPEFDLVIRGGNVVTDGKVKSVDVGVRGELIAAIGPHLGAGKREIDARGRWVLPGGIDSHCHVEQRSGMGMMGSDDFYAATVSAAFGGTTTIIPFAAQHREQRVTEVLADYHARAAAKAVVDYGFHLIVANPDEQAMSVDIPKAIDEGVTSLKVYMTYERMRLDDYQLLDMMTLAKEKSALIMLHAENHDMIRWLTHRLLDRGHKAPKYHGVAHDPLAESEATNRAIAFSRLLDVPILIVHVAGAETVQVLRDARHLGAKVLAESCPQYMFLSEEDMDRPGMEGAKFCCSPPLRSKKSQKAIWDGFLDGTLLTYSSDHAPYKFDESGKLPKADATTFKEMANGMPGLELRLPLLFSEGVATGRIDIHQFVALTAGNHAQLYGLAGKKGEISVGADADVAVWDPDKELTITWNMLHDSTGYTPYEGRRIKGWPTTVLSRGRVVVENNKLQAERGSGQFLRRGKPVFEKRLTIPSPRARGFVLKALVGLEGK